MRLCRCAVPIATSLLDRSTRPPGPACGIPKPGGRGKVKKNLRLRSTKVCCSDRKAAVPWLAGLLACWPRVCLRWCAALGGTPGAHAGVPPRLVVVDARAHPARVQAPRGAHVVCTSPQKGITTDSHLCQNRLQRKEARGCARHQPRPGVPDIVVDSLEAPPNPSRGSTAAGWT